jgi:hypothetical protein
MRERNNSHIPTGEKKKVQASGIRKSSFVEFRIPPGLK